MYEHRNVNLPCIEIKGENLFRSCPPESCEQNVCYNTSKFIIVENASSRHHARTYDRPPSSCLVLRSAQQLAHISKSQPLQQRLSWALWLFHVADVAMPNTRLACRLPKWVRVHVQSRLALGVFRHCLLRRVACRDSGPARNG